MSDNTRLTGTLTFSRPLTWREYREHLAVIDNNDHVLAFTEVHEHVDTDDGPMVRRTAVGIEPRDIHGSCYGRGAETELAALAKLVDALDVRANGWLYRTAGGGLERMRVDYPGGRPTSVLVDVALTVWPDGTSAYVAEEAGHGWFTVPGSGPAMFDGYAMHTLVEVLDHTRAGEMRR